MGYVNGKAEMLREGNPQPVQVNKTFIVGQSVITPAKSPLTLDLKADEPKHWFVVGWKPFAVVDLEVDDEELDEKAADSGGILDWNSSGNRKCRSVCVCDRHSRQLRQPNRKG